MRVPNIYRAFPAACGIIAAVENQLVRNKDIDVYMAPDRIAEFRAGLQDRELGAWQEFWNVKPRRFKYLGISIHQDIDGGDDTHTPTLHWMGVPVLRFVHSPEGADATLKGDTVLEAVNDFPNVGEAEWYGCYRLSRSGVTTRTLDFALPTLRPMWTWDTRATDDHKLAHTSVSGSRLMELGLVLRETHNPQNDERASYKWSLTTLGKNALRQFLVAEVMKRRAKK